ncbi:MAG: 3,4-dihydroxy-2-butanone-4-phosphate synthase [Lentisphaeraceae bacterium]|nr:3,4-dihydroxy-2-butanone-4-phosphate synthase [Lentisphaeraceae bacterium]
MSHISTEAAISQLKEGRMLILQDSSGANPRGCFVLPADFSTPDEINKMIVYGRGQISLVMGKTKYKDLDLPLNSEDQVSFDAKDVMGTGISALDRNTTIKVASAAHAQLDDIKRPGHIFSIEAEEGGCLVRPTVADAAFDLIRLGKIGECAVVCDILNQNGDYASLDELEKLSKELSLPTCSVHEIVEYRVQNEPLVENINIVDMPTEYGNFRLHVYKSKFDKNRGVDLALTFGADRFSEDDIPLVRVHSEWSIANIVNRLSNDHGSYLNLAMKTVADAGGVGAIVFLRNTPEQHTNSLFNNDKRPTDIWKEDGKIRTLSPMGKSMSYGFGAQILRDLGVRKMKLLANKDVSLSGLDKYGLEIVEQVRF